MKKPKMLVGYNYMNHLKTFGYADKELEGFELKVLNSMMLMMMRSWF